MKIRKREDRDPETQLQLSSLIDVVFLLLVFFVLTFRIVAMEGDFNVRMATLPEPGTLVDVDLPPMQVRLQADSEGALTTVELNGQRLAGPDGLRNRLLSLAESNSTASGLLPNSEMVLHCDPNLKYDYVVQIITAASGVESADGEMMPLVEKIRFRPREK
jgi:biopolymer transport protein ExbD